MAGSGRRRNHDKRWASIIRRFVGLSHPNGNRLTAREYAMRHFLSMASVIVAVTMQGCAGTDSIINQAGRQSLQSLQLFNADTSPRFTFYLACTGADASCNTTNNAFSDWASDRHVKLRLVEPSDALFTSGIPSFGRSADQPYRVAVNFVPLVVPSFNEIRFEEKTHWVATFPRKSATARRFMYSTPRPESSCNNCRRTSNATRAPTIMQTGISVPR